MRETRRIFAPCIAAVLLWSTALAQDRDFPAELVHFNEADSNPVFTAAGPEAWDARIRERGWILRESDNWKMWYTGYDGTREGLKHLGYATSPDGIHWTRHPGNPIYTAHWVEDIMVVPHEGTYYMFAEGRSDQAHLLTSADGIAWTRVGPLDVRMHDGTPIEPGPYGTPSVWLEDGIWHLFYERGDRGIWLATSEDLEIWTNVRDEPVLVPGPDDYDRDLVALNQIIRHNGRYYASYHGASTIHSPALWTSNLAVSDDLIHWRKYAGNPLFPISENKSSGVFVPDGDGYRLYTMHDQVRLHQPVDEPGFVPLFPDDGVPDGWLVRRWNDVSQPVEADVVWRVEDGVARGSEPRGTWLVSEREYGDFELRFDWKLGGRGNSGCGLRFPAAGDPAFDGLELQMVDPRYYDDQRVPNNELTGGLYRAVAPTEQLFRPNDWNSYAVTCNGPHVTVLLNGKQILDVDLDTQSTPTTRHDGTAAPPLKDRPRRGRVGFQELSRTGHVQIRNARIRELE